jgi:hypothetical protein
MFSYWLRYYYYYYYNYYYYYYYYYIPGRPWVVLRVKRTHFVKHIPEDFRKHRSQRKTPSTLIIFLRYFTRTAEDWGVWKEDRHRSRTTGTHQHHHGLVRYQALDTSIFWLTFLTSSTLRFIVWEFGFRSHSGYFSQLFCCWYLVSTGLL